MWRLSVSTVESRSVWMEGRGLRFMALGRVASHGKASGSGLVSSAGAPTPVVLHGFRGAPIPLRHGIFVRIWLDDVYLVRFTHKIERAQQR